ncbi:MAG: 30S ribosome-binding factor RbfA [Paracoccaceae bacterium]|nr:30S ribosome-binding factor RbfA [Paracoccaceae bacterium]
MARPHHDHGTGPSQRQLRVGETIRRALSDVLTRGEHHEPELDGVPITVGEVRCSPDLKVATAYVMPLGGRDTEHVLAALERAKGELRRQVTRAVQLKFSPELRFRLDETFDRMDETRRLLGEDQVRRDLDGD